MRSRALGQLVGLSTGARKGACINADSNSNSNSKCQWNVLCVWMLTLWSRCWLESTSDCGPAHNCSISRRQDRNLLTAHLHSSANSISRTTRSHGGIRPMSDRQWVNMALQLHTHTHECMIKMAIFPVELVSQLPPWVSFSVYSYTLCVLLAQAQTLHILHDTITPNLPLMTALSCSINQYHHTVFHLISRIFINYIDTINQTQLYTLLLIHG